MFSALAPFLRNSLMMGLTRDALLAMEPETAHQATLMALKLGLAPKPIYADAPQLKTRIAGLDMSNPIGMAAGFDKNAEVTEALGEMGFGFAEAGTLTPRAQDGNPRPRLFRLTEAGGVINRMGFNNQGHAAAHVRLAAERSKAVVGVNIGANKTSADFVADYVAGVKRFAGIANYLTVNISSPNTPGLRGLQEPEMLKRLLGEVLRERAAQNVRVPLFLKIAPDLDEHALDEISKIVLATDLDGMIVSNTTLSRSAVAGQPYADEAGGLSGKPLFNFATQKLAQVRLRVRPDLPLIGVGGVHSAETALAKFEAGANAIQLYSALVYGGLGLLDEIKLGLTQSVKRVKARNISDFVGRHTADWAAGKLSL